MDLLKQHDLCWWFWVCLLLWCLKNHDVSYYQLLLGFSYSVVVTDISSGSWNTSVDSWLSLVWLTHVQWGSSAGDLDKGLLQRVSGPWSTWPHCLTVQGHLTVWLPSVILMNFMIRSVVVRLAFMRSNIWVLVLASLRWFTYTTRGLRYTRAVYLTWGNTRDPVVVFQSHDEGTQELLLWYEVPLRSQRRV